MGDIDRIGGEVKVVGRGKGRGAPCRHLYSRPVATYRQGGQRRGHREIVDTCMRYVRRRGYISMPLRAVVYQCTLMNPRIMNVRVQG
jgi:hypothetical protein